MQQYDGSASKSRVAAVVCMGGMLIISAAQLAMAVYLLLNGTREALLIVTESFMIYSSSISLIYLGLPLLFFRRCQRFAVENPQMASRSKSTSLIHLALIIAMWTIASALCLIIAIRDSVNERPLPPELQQDDMRAYSVQMASIAASFAALLFTCILFWSIHSAARPVVLSLFSIYRSRKSQKDQHPVIEKNLDSPTKRGATTEVSECFPPRYEKIKRSGTPTAWRPHTHFEFPSKAPTRASLRISHPYPIPTNEASDSIAFPALPDSPASIPVSPHTRRWRSKSASSQTPPRTPRKSFSNSIPVGRTSHDSHRMPNKSFSSSIPAGRMSHDSPRPPRKSFSSSIPVGRKSNDSAAPSQQHMRSGSVPKTPTRPESRPVMPPAAFWQYAIEKQSIDMTSPGILQRWQLQGDRRSLPSSVGRSSPVPTSSTRGVTPNAKAKGRSDKAKGKRSLDSQERRTYHRQIEGPLTEHFDGITWEIASPPLAQPRGKERQSRKLVKKRRSSHQQQSLGCSIVP